MWEAQSSGVLVMSTPILVGDLRLTLKKTYSVQQLAELDQVLAGLGIDMEASKHLEIIPEADISARVEELSLEMAGLSVMPWCMSVNTQAVIDSCFSKVTVFGEPYFFHSSFYRPAVVEVFITADGVRTGGVMAG